MSGYFESNPQIEVTEIDFPRNILEFQELFGTEEACEQYLFQVKWPEGFVCPRCENDAYYYIKGRRLLECTECGHQTSLTAGTVMHRTRTPLRIWFYAAYLAVTQTPGMSARQFRRQVGLKSYEVAFNMLHKLRAAMVRPERDKIHGLVEMDETFIGGPEHGKVGRGALGKVLVAGAVEIRDNPKDGTMSGRLRLKIIPDASFESLYSFISLNIEMKSIIVTDDWRGYWPLSKRKYRHRVAGPGELIHIHRTFGNLKTWLRGTHHGVSEKHLQAYLNEFVFRHNRRFSPMAAFKRILGLAMHTRGPTYKELYKSGEREGWVHPNE